MNFVCNPAQFICMAPQGERLGRCRPVLNAAHGISGDAAGNLYLAEPSPSRVTRMVPI